jgi:hypothetical protein
MDYGIQIQYPVLAAIAIGNNSAVIRLKESFGLNITP